MEHWCVCEGWENSGVSSPPRGVVKGFPSKYWGIEHGQGVKVDGYAGGDNYLWRIGVCVRVGKIAKCHLRPWIP